MAKWSFVLSCAKLLYTGSLRALKHVEASGKREQSEICGKTISIIVYLILVMYNNLQDAGGQLTCMSYYYRVIRCGHQLRELIIMEID